MSTLTTIHEHQKILPPAKDALASQPAEIIAVLTARHVQITSGTGNRAQVKPMID